MRNFEFQIQVNRILQIFDEMIRRIETLLCIQEFIKDHKLMGIYFPDDDIEDFKRYCSGYTPNMDLNDPDESDNVFRLIQMLLNTDLHSHSEPFKHNVCTISFFYFPFQQSLA